jgi:hypothetical protein
MQNAFFSSKRRWLFLFLTSLLTLRLAAQTPIDQLADRRSRDKNKREVVQVSAGPNERVWLTRSRGRIVEMASGLNYWHGQRWAPSEAVFKKRAHSFIATKMQYKVDLSANLNTPGAVTVVTRDDLILRSTPVAIGLYDSVSGQSTIIGAIKDSEGVQLGDNWVVYRDAFDGVCADVIYRIEIGSFSQDVVITGRLNSEDYGFPSQTTRLLVFTEFYNPPEPETVLRPIYIEHDIVVRNGKVSPDFVDEILGFGEFVIATGRAMTMENIADPEAPAAPVAKQFTTIDGRRVMIESVELRFVGEVLRNLPDCDNESASIGKPLKGRLGKADGIVIPAAGAKEQARATTKPVRTAQVSAVTKPGFVIDYIASIGGTLSGSQVFQGDATYFLADAVTCSGPVTIEAGVVFKFPTDAGVSLKLQGSVTCQASSYRPAIFTAGDDDTIGDKLTTTIWPGYTGIIQTNIYGSPAYGSPALWIYHLTNASLSNLHFRYSEEALRLERGNSDEHTCTLAIDRLLQGYPHHRIGQWSEHHGKQQSHRRSPISAVLRHRAGKCDVLPQHDREHAAGDNRGGSFGGQLHKLDLRQYHSALFRGGDVVRGAQRILQQPHVWQCTGEFGQHTVSECRRGELLSRRREFIPRLRSEQYTQWFAASGFVKANDLPTTYLHQQLCLPDCAQSSGAARL